MGRNFRYRPVSVPGEHTRHVHADTESASGDRRSAVRAGGGGTRVRAGVPVVFAVLFGTLTYGLWFNDSLNLRQGLREASRQGVVANYGTETCAMTYMPGGEPSANIAKLMCRAQSDVGAMTGETYIKVVYLRRLGPRPGARRLRHGPRRPTPGVVPLPATG